MQKPTSEIIRKFYCNECSVSEREMVLNYLASLEKEEQDEFLDNHLNFLNDEKRQYLNKTSFKKILEKINLIKNSETRKRHYSYSVAASIAVLFFIFISVILIINNGSVKDLEETKWIVKETKLGQKSIITLLDGTRITLNSDSKLRYPSKFDEMNREVYLSGEAYFEVTHMAETPFIVHSDKSSTTVLGTKFNVNAFSDDDKIKVSLVEGSVIVSNDYNEISKNEVKLIKGEQVIINKKSGDNKITNFDPLQVTGWKDNVLVFKKTPIIDVFKVLSRTYGIKFELQENINNHKKITVNFDNENFWTIVKVIKKITKLNYLTIEEDNQLLKIVFTKEQVARRNN